MTMAWGSLMAGWFRFAFHFFLCETTYVDGVTVERFGVLGSGYFLFNLGGFSLSLFFCGVLVVDRFLFFPCPFGVVFAQSDEGGGSEGRWGGGGGGRGACGLVGQVVEVVAGERTSIKGVVQYWRERIIVVTGGCISRSDS